MVKRELSAKSSKICSVSRAKKKKAQYLVEEQVHQEDVPLPGSDPFTSGADSEELGFDAPVQRGWSPSVPLRHSLDEEMDEG